MQLIPDAIIDGRNQDITFSLIGNTTIAATLPHFWTSAGVLYYLPNLPPSRLNIYYFIQVLDPNYAILVDLPSDGSCSGQSGLNHKSIIVISLFSY